MYMDDAIRATMNLMEAEANKLHIRSYNLGAMSFTPKKLAACVQSAHP